MTESYPRRTSDLSTEELVNRLNGAGYLILSDDDRLAVKEPRARLPIGHRADPDSRYDPLVFGCPRIFGA